MPKNPFAAVRSSFNLSLALGLVLLPFFAVNSHAAEAKAEEEEDYGSKFSFRTPQTLDTVIVTADRVEKKSSEVSENVTVIDSEQMERMPGQDVADKLLYVPGVNVSSRTRLGHLQPLTIEGSQSRHVRLMVDGIPFNTQLSGQSDTISSFSGHALDRIEVVKGSSTGVWGSSLGGLVNLLTKEVKPGQETHAKTQASWGEYKTRQQIGEVEGGTEDWGYYLIYDSSQSAGSRSDIDRINRDDTFHKKFFGKMATNPTEVSDLTLSFGYTGSEVNEGTYLTSPSVFFNTPYVTRYGKVAYEQEIDAKTRFESAFKFNHQTIQSSFLILPNNTLASFSDTRDSFYGVDLLLAHNPRPEDEWIIGYDWQFNRIKSNAMTSARDVNNHAPYTQYTLGLGDWDLSSGVRFDGNSEFGEQWNPHFGAIYHFQTERPLIARFNATRAFNTPPLYWKYFDNPNPFIPTANNPNIEPERAWVYGTGIESEPWEGAWMKFSLFLSEIEDAINISRNANGEVIRANFEEFRRQGIEFESGLSITDDLAVQFAMGWTDTINELTDTLVIGNDSSRQNFRFGLDYTLLERTHFYLNGRWDRWDSTSGVFPNDRKFIFDARIAHSLPNLLDITDAELFLNIYNITDAKTWSNIDFPNPPRYYEGGLSLEF